MRRVLLIIFVFVSLSAMGQGKYGKATPQVVDFMKYGETSAPMFNGHMSFEVPIYHYKDQDFDIPIRLIYTAEGFKPAKRADIVGLDWTIAAGGNITREIYGAADDSKPHDPESQELGYYLAVKEGRFDKNKIWNLDTSVVKQSSDSSFYYLTSKEGYWVDFQPDLFLFNFNGHSGQFLIDDDATAKSTNRAYKIDISNLKTQFLELNNLDGTSTIRITTPEGYIYEFGGHISRLEYNITFIDGNAPSSYHVHPTIMAWHLSKITAPNGRVVTFNYMRHDDILNSTNNPLWQSSQVEALKNEHGQPVNNTWVGVATKKSILKSIVIDNTIIEFYYSVEETLESDYNKFHSHQYYNSAVYQLDSIDIKHSNSKLSDYKFEYENKHKRRFLKEIKLPENTSYLFTYNHTSYPLPEDTKDTDGTKIDLYGFWKANNNASSYGLISRVDYPTGGYSTFEYEKQDYSKEVEFNAQRMNKYLIESANMYKEITSLEGSDTMKPFDESSTLIKPKKPKTVTKYHHNGARIKKISNYTEHNVKVTEKEYIYNNLNKSSGILYQSRPVVGIHKDNGEKIYGGGNDWRQNYNIDEPAIGYSTVTERNSDGSYYEYGFYDWHDSQDNLKDVKLKFINGQKPQNLMDTISLALTGHSRIASYSDRRGKIKYKKHYTNSKILKLEESYNYIGLPGNYIPIEHEIEEQNRDYVVAFLSMTGGGMVKKIYLDKYHPVKNTRITMDNVKTSQSYSYNDYDLLYSTQFDSSTGDNFRTEYFYPFDYSSNLYSNMVLYNQLSTVIEQVNYRIKNDNKVEINRTKTDYVQKSTKLYVPDKTLTSLDGNALREVISYNEYDKWGNVLQQIGIDGVSTAFIWSDDGKYLIAEVVNAIYNQVKNVNINQLRSQFPKSFVTTYTYKPLVGITSKTDPRGVTTYYEYDSNNRLKRSYIVENGIAKTIETYDYHYKP